MAPAPAKLAISEAELRHLLDDAKVAMERYQRRSEPGRALSADERKAWAKETVDLVGRLSHVLATAMGPPDYRDDRKRRSFWLDQFVGGYRTLKPLPSDPEEWRKPPRPKWREAFDQHGERHPIR